MYCLWVWVTSVLQAGNGTKEGAMYLLLLSQDKRSRDTEGHNH